MAEAEEAEDKTDAATANATPPFIVGHMAAVAIQVLTAAKPNSLVIKTMQPSRIRWAVARTTVSPYKLGPNMKIIQLEIT